MTDTDTGRPSPAELIRDGAADGRWEVVGERSRVHFAVKHFWGLVTVRGSFARVTGVATVTVGNIAASLSLEAESVRTGIAKRDAHLRSPDFFDAAAHPNLTFTTGHVSMAGEDRVEVLGELQAAGHRRPVAFEGDLAALGGGATLGDGATLDARLELDRREFAMTWSPLRMAAPTVALTVHLEFVRAGDER